MEKKCCRFKCKSGRGAEWEANHFASGLYYFCNDCKPIFDDPMYAMKFRKVGESEWSRVSVITRSEAVERVVKKEAVVQGCLF